MFLKKAIISTRERFITKHSREKGITISLAEITGKHRVSLFGHGVQGIENAAAHRAQRR